MPNSNAQLSDKKSRVKNLAAMKRQTARSSNDSKVSKYRSAIPLLKADHAEVKKCFQQYQKLVDGEAGSDERQALAQKICLLLTVHATIEEEIFYPAARVVLEDNLALVDKADVEHASAKALIAEIQGMNADADHFDAKVKVLGEYIDHHVKEEQDEMFPKCQETDMDLKGVGMQLAERKEVLIAEHPELQVAS